MSRAVVLGVAVCFAVANWFILQWVGAVLFHYADPVFFATILTASLLIHELFHWLVFEFNGVRSFFFLAVVFGAAGPYPSCAPQVLGLKWASRAAISIAGVVGNAAMIPIGLILYLAGAITGEQLGAIANLNGSMILCNLLPFYILDGGRVAKFIFDSVSESRDFKFVFVIATAFITAAAVLMLVWSQNYFVPVGVLVFGLLRQATTDDPRGSKSKLAMSFRQQVFFACLYAGLVLFGILLLTVTDNWFVMLIRHL